MQEINHPWMQFVTIGNYLFAGVAQLVERQPSKLNVAGSNPVTRFTFPFRSFASEGVFYTNTLQQSPAEVGAIKLLHRTTYVA
jgi:hypothetical protein|tara:strand:+ start:219 stop:467 length:249 start_codon:yes stop_codon:yes gene_type:complete